MKTLRWLPAALAMCVFSTRAGAQWSDDFDSYSPGTNIVGQGGWREFNGVPGGSSVVSNTFALSAPHSVATRRFSNTIREFSGYTSGRWIFKTQVYIPSTTTDEFWFQFMSFYKDNGPYFWTVSIELNSPSPGTALVWGGANGNGQVGVVYDRWAELKLVIDLNLDTIEIFYDGQPTVPPYQYTRGYDGIGTGPKEIRAVELHWIGNNTSGQKIYFDDFQLDLDFPPPTFFCTAKSALVCGPPAISSSGAPSVSAPKGFVVSAAPARSCKSGILLYNTAVQTPALPFQGGSLCVTAAGLKRAGGTNSQGTPGPANCDGAFSIDVLEFAKLAWAVPDCAGNPTGSVQNNPAPFLLNMGQTVYGQYWGRDSTSTGSFVSDAIAWITVP